MRLEKIIINLAIIYIIVGMVFASLYALFYHWSALSLFSPGFYMVLITWPLKVPGLIGDFQYYGFAGKTFF